MRVAYIRLNSDDDRAGHSLTVSTDAGGAASRTVVTLAILDMDKRILRGLDIRIP